MTAGGVASFTFRYRGRGTGKYERLTLGRYPGLSLRDARQKANALRAEIDNGKNPAAHKRSASDRTFAGLAERYLIEHARRFKKSADGRRAEFAAAYPAALGRSATSPESSAAT